MIRREVNLEGSGPQWMLISQIEHARLSGDLARHWGTGGIELLEPNEEVLRAIYHHDDGWAQWETHPRVDPHNGRPFAFTEMPLDDSLAIWRRSIELSAEIGPLAAWIVAGHFSALLRDSSSAGDGRAIAWLGEFEKRRAEWLAEWTGNQGAAQAQAIADRALAHLRLFDALSLWFCCAERSEPHLLRCPGGVCRFVPASQAVTIAPWPLRVPELQVEVVGDLVEAQPYTDRTLDLTLRRRHKLCWRLRRGA